MNVTDSDGAAGTPPPPDIPSPNGNADDSSGDRLRERLAEAVKAEYEVLDELGKGGMATVYRARDLSLDRFVAIKVLTPYLLDVDENIAERFRREARTAARLSHPHIIPIHQVRQVDRLLFFVMKHVQGRPLDSIIKQLGRLPVPMVQLILTQVGAALAYAHRQNVIHRDIKPANIMLDDEGYAVITDFGVAKVHDLFGLTESGMRIGTPLYMSPEQCAGGRVTPAADQYGLGISLYEMLTGKVPFTGNTMQEVARGHMMGTAVPVAAIRPDCTRALSRGVMRMLAKEPGDRWPDIEAAVVGCTARGRRADDPVREEMIELGRSGNRAGNRGLSVIGAPTVPLTGAIQLVKPLQVVDLGPPQSQVPKLVRSRATTALGVVAALIFIALLLHAVLR